MSSPESQHRFATTCWSMVTRAGGEGGAAGEALSSLLRAYWYPLYAYVRRRGIPAADAEDAVQDFFAHVLRYDVVSYADQQRGRFRTFILTALNQHLGGWRRASGHRAAVVPIDAGEGEHRYGAEPVSKDQDPATEFDREWMRNVLALSLQSLRAEYEHAGNAAFFDEARACLDGSIDPPTAEIAARHGMTPGAVRVAMHRLRKRFGECLRTEVARLVEDPSQVDAELQEMVRLFSSDGA